MSLYNHHRKWSNQLAEECSTFTSTISLINKYQTSQHHLLAHKENHMPQEYRNYAKSIDKKKYKGREEESMYDYLKTLSFVKCRHTEDCTYESRLKKKKANFKTEKVNTNIQTVHPIQTQHIHTVKTVLVPNTHHIFHQQPIMRVERPINPPIVLRQRPSSAPKIFINYASPTNTASLQFNQYTKHTQYVNNQPLLKSSYKKKGIEIAQHSNQQEVYKIKVTPNEQSKMMRSREDGFVGDASKKSDTLSNSLKIEGTNMKASDVLVYTFKQIGDEPKWS